MSQAIYDMVAYTKLTDQVYYQILHSTDEGLKGVRTPQVDKDKSINITKTMKA